MKSKIIYISTLLSVLFSQENTLAVLPFDAAGITPNEAIILTDRLSTEFYKIGSYIVIERSKMDEVLKEQGFQQSGCATSECAVQVGNLLGVEKMVTGTLGRLGSLYTISARIVDVESGKIEKQVSKDIRGSIETLLLETMAEVATELSGVSTPKTPVKPLKGKVWFESDPSGANIEVNGKNLGYTPFFKEGEVGIYQFTAIKENYENYEGEFDIKDNETIDVKIKLKPRLTTLKVKGEDGIELFFQNKSLGFIENGLLEIDSLMVGTYVITGRKYGFVQKSISAKISSHLIDYEEKIVLKPIRIRLSLLNLKPDYKITLSNNEKTYSYSDQYQFIPLELGTYKIKVESYGYLTHESEINIIESNKGKQNYIIPNLNPILVPVSFNVIPHHAKVVNTNNVQKYGTLEYLPFNKYSIFATAPKYQSIKRIFHVNDNSAKSININLKPKERSTALKYSSFLPGTGQFYAENKRKSAVFFLASAGLVALCYNSYDAYQVEEPLVSQYKLGYQNASNPDEIDQRWNIYQNQVNTVNDLQTQLMLYGGTLAVTWIVNIIDAYFFSGLLE